MALTELELCKKREAKAARRKLIAPHNLRAKVEAWKMRTRGLDLADSRSRALDRFTKPKPAVEKRVQTSFLGKALNYIKSFGRGR
ncbi:MAG: hypothetical protein WC822_02470 [Candidatus Paceibacterota bacterium]|jgi:hypothetical protein